MSCIKLTVKLLLVTSERNLKVISKCLFFVYIIYMCMYTMLNKRYLMSNRTIACLALIVSWILKDNAACALRHTERKIVSTQEGHKVAFFSYSISWKMKHYTAMSV